MTDDRPITLAEAASEYRMTVSTLRAEAGRGRLDIFRIGRRDYTTPQAMREMVERCRAASRRHGSGWTVPENSGLSEMARASSAQVALSQTVQALKSSLRPTSGTNTNRRAGLTR
jgi:DNA-binding response OmpR family regulator